MDTLESGILLLKLPHLIPDERFWIGITSTKICTKSAALSSGKIRAEAFLWQGQVDEAIVLFENSAKKQAHNFCEYLSKHRHRIVNYDYFQSCCGFAPLVQVQLSLPFEQVDRRLQISGAQWNREHVPQVLEHRCAYLNGLIGSQT